MDLTGCWLSVSEQYFYMTFTVSCFICFCVLYTVCLCVSRTSCIHCIFCTCVIAPNGVINQDKSEGLRLSTYIQQQATLCRLTSAVRYRQGLYSPQSTAQARTHGLWSAAMQWCIATVFRFNGLHTNNPCKCTYYYSYTNPAGDGRLSWFSWLTQSRQFTHEVVTCEP